MYSLREKKEDLKKKWTLHSMGCQATLSHLTYGRIIDSYRGAHRRAQL